VPFVRQRTKRLRQHLESSNPYRRFAGFSDKTYSFHAEEIPQVEQLENLRVARATFLQIHEKLDSAADIAQVKKLTLAHVSMGGDAAGGPHLFAFGKSLANFADRTGNLERATKRVDLFVD
jgi:hypothetical protein